MNRDFSGERRGFSQNRDFSGERRGFPQRFEKPVKVNDEYDVEIGEVGEKGDGIAKVNNFVVFVPTTKKGDKCKIKIVFVGRRFAVAEKISGKAKKKEEKVEDENDEKISGKAKKKEEKVEDENDEDK